MRKEKPTEEELVAKAYNELAQELPTRELDKPKPAGETGDGEPRTLGEAMSSTEDMTDLQSAMAKEFPGAVDFNSVMIGRIDPNVFISMLHLMSNSEIMRADPTKPIDVDLVYMRNYVRLSIGLDGMGRIDIAELVGASRRQKEAERLLKGGGL